MSTGWPRVRLGDVLRFTPRPVTVESTRTYREIGIRSHGRGIFHKPPVIGLDLGSKKVFYIEPDDFVLNIVFAWEGAVAVTSEAEAGMIASHRFPTFRPDPARLEVKYLQYWCQTELGRNLLDRVSPGGAGRNRTLNRGAFLNQDIPLPPLAKQRQVVARIDELATQVNDARTLRQQASARAESLLVAMAHGRNSAHVEGHSPGWRRMRLSECIRLIDHAQRVSPDQRYPNIGIYSFGRGLFPKSPIDGAATSATTLRRVTAGQFIYSRLFAFEGAFGMVTDKYDGHFVSGEYPTFECDPSLIRVEFLAAYFKAPSVWKEVSIGSKGLGHRRQRVQPTQVLEHSILVPPLAWQDRLAKVQAEVDQLKLLQAQITAELDAMRPAVLKRAFKGEL